MDETNPWKQHLDKEMIHYQHIKKMTIFIHYRGPRRRRERERTEKIFEEIIVENFPNIGKEIDTQVQEAQRVPYRINPMRHIVINLAKN